ncbi:hypothetical protein ACFL9U_12060 [Thermodesulfobacteriota bacterium]
MAWVAGFSQDIAFKGAACYATIYQLNLSPPVTLGFGNRIGR